MAALPDRKTLASMRRADLQKICKERGLKANMKTEELIDLLLETDKPVDPPRVPGRSSSVRIVSRAGPSTARGRVGSMIVHDMEVEAEDVGAQVGESSRTNTPVEQMQHDPSGPSTRKKAKETQSRLGVGRPTILGGSGHRPPSSSSGKPRSRRGKAIAAAQPSEAVIQEEEEEPEPIAVPDSMPDLPSTGHDPHHRPIASSSNSTSFFHSPEDLKSFLTSMIEPLKAQINGLQAQLELATRSSEDVHSLRSSITELSAELATLQGRDLDRTRLMESLREELAALKLARTEGQADVAMNSGIPMVAGSSALAPATPGPSTVQIETPKSALGKRQRDSEDGAVVAAAASSTSPKRILRSSKKRVKISRIQNEDVLDAGPSGDVVANENEVEMIEAAAPRPFTVFSGPEEPPENEVLTDEPRPATHLSDLYTFPAMTPPNGATPSVPISTSQGAENRAPATGNAFSFSFAHSIFRPMTSTPAARSPTTLPPPQPPTSPTPVGPGSSLFPYAPTGSKPRPGSRPNSRAAQSQAQLGVAGPSSASASSSSRATAGDGTITPLGVGLPGIVPLPMPPDTPDQPMKRTMYGTELEGDSRFGDFGVEGVAMGFWTGAAPRF